jgi:hypothetical protein
MDMGVVGCGLLLDALCELSAVKLTGPLSRDWLKWLLKENITEVRMANGCFFRRRLQQVLWDWSQGSALYCYLFERTWPEMQ